MASYAKQAEDDTLHKYAVRISARAIRRAGELLKTFDGRGRPDISMVDHAISQREAANVAGLSKHQQDQAVRVANVPEQQFNNTVDGGEKFTITKLADEGKKTKAPINPYPDAKPAPEGFVDATNAMGALRDLAEFASKHDAARWRINPATAIFSRHSKKIHEPNDFR